MNLLAVRPEITIKYRCFGCCNMAFRELKLQARGATEDIKTFLERCQGAVSRDHTLLSPSCSYGKCDLMLPLGAADVIGAPQDN